MVPFHQLLVLLILCWNVPATSPTPPHLPSASHCQRVADVVILVDTSRSIYVTDYPLQLQFVRDVIGQFDVSPTTTRIAVISYSHGYRIEFGLDSHQTADSMLQAVDSIPFTQGGRLDTHLAFRQARDLLLRHSRKEAAHVIIYITNGRATDPQIALKEAARTKRKNILVFSVGIGPYVDRAELGQIATQASQQFVYPVGSFSDLGETAQVIGPEICAVPTSAAPPVSRCHRAADVVILVDTSRSIYVTDFPLQLQFVRDVIGQFDVSPTTTRVAVISYSHGHRTEFGLDSYQTADSMLKAVDNIHFTKGGRLDSHQAFRKARDLLLRHPRDKAAHVIIYITNGRATDRYETGKEVKRVKEEGILIFTVGAGRYVSIDQLRELASSSSSEDSEQFAHSVDSFLDLDLVSQDLGPQICAAVTKKTKNEEEEEEDEDEEDEEEEEEAQVEIECPEELQDFHVPHPEDCGKFFKCVHGVPHLYSCPSPLHFNTVLNVCDYPDNANCTVTAAATTTSTTSATTTTTVTATTTPTTTETTSEEPTTQDTTTIPPTTTEPATIEPTTDEITTLEPTTIESTTDEITTMEATTTESTTDEITTMEATTIEPTTDEITTMEPTTIESTTDEITTLEPTTIESTTDEITTMEPTTIESTTDEITTTEPTTDEENEEAATIEPNTAEPSTMEPNTLESTTTTDTATTTTMTDTDTSTAEPTNTLTTTATPITIAPCTPIEDSERKYVFLIKDLSLLEK